MVRTRRSSGPCHLGDSIDALFDHFEVRLVNIHGEGRRAGIEGISPAAGWASLRQGPKAARQSQLDPY